MTDQPKPLSAEEEQVYRRWTETDVDLPARAVSRLLSALDAERARIEKLKEALTKYGHHDTWRCSIGRDPGDGCDCGFDAALKGADRD